MYGKHFSSTYNGSMYGAGPNVFAVWGYIIANTVNAHIELNPRQLAATIGKMTEDEVREVLEYLCSPDEHSRNTSEDGRRLMREGQYSYRVVTHEMYRSMRNEDDRREYLRQKQREHRIRNPVKSTKQSVNIDSQQLSTMSTAVNHGQPPSTHTEAYTETEAKAEAIKDKTLSISAKSHPANAGKVVSPTEEIYRAYPRHVGPKVAFAAIDKAITKLMQGKTAIPRESLSKKAAQEMLKAIVQTYAASPVGQQPDKTKIPHPSTWFNQERWDDDPATWQQVNGGLNGNGNHAKSRTSGNREAIFGKLELGEHARGGDQGMLSAAFGVHGTNNDARGSESIRRGPRTLDASAVHSSVRDGGDDETLFSSTGRVAQDGWPS